MMESRFLRLSCTPRANTTFTWLKFSVATRDSQIGSAAILWLLLLHVELLPLESVNFTIDSAPCKQNHSKILSQKKNILINIRTYIAACDELLNRNRKAVGNLIETQLNDEPSTFTDFVDDDGHGIGPFAIKCTMQKKNGKLYFDWDGTSPQSQQSINYYLNETM